MDENNFNLTARDCNDIRIVYLSGRLDIDSAPMLNNTIEQYINSGVRKLLINMDDLNHLSSAGLGALINIRNMLLKAGGIVKICHTPNNLMITRIFELHSFMDIIELFHSEEEAVQSY